MIERSQVRVLAGAVGEFSSPELTFCADSYSVSVPPCVTTVACTSPVILPKMQVVGYIKTHVYTLDPTKSEWADYAVT